MPERTRASAADVSRCMGWSNMTKEHKRKFKDPKSMLQVLMQLSIVARPLLPPSRP